MNKIQTKMWLWLMTIAVMSACALSLAGKQTINQIGNYEYPHYSQRPVRPSKSLGTKPTRLYTTTAYSKIETCPERECITASGTTAEAGRTIACPRKIKFGTKVLINDHEYVCEDRTAYRYDGRFDIFMDSYQDALDFGKQQLTITIL